MNRTTHHYAEKSCEALITLHIPGLTHSKYFSPTSGLNDYYFYSNTEAGHFLNVHVADINSIIT